MYLPEKMIGFLEYKEKMYSFSLTYDDFILKLFPEQSRDKEQGCLSMITVQSELGEDTLCFELK